MAMNRPPICLEIVEQPKQRGMRFRYECEGRSAGSIPGENTTNDRKTWPTCQILNYVGIAIMRVSLVSKDDPPRPHPHSLVGRDCENGICQLTIDPSNQMQGVFPNLGIQCVRRREVSSAIRERLQRGVNPFDTPIDGDERAAVDVDLNIVRLCFEAFLQDQHGNYTRKLPPVVSNPIYDKKATSSSLLKICRVDKTHGSVRGNDEIFLLCDKVQKEDIQVVFSHDGWEALGDFSSPDVHRQVAIVFRTPPYRDENIQESVEVKFKLRRPSDMETSMPLTFTYLPVQHGTPLLAPFPMSLSKSFLHDDPKRKMIRKKIEGRAGKYSIPSRRSMQPSQFPFQMPPRFPLNRPPIVTQQPFYSQLPGPQTIKPDSIDNQSNVPRPRQVPNIKTEAQGDFPGMMWNNPPFSNAQPTPLSTNPTNLNGPFSEHIPPDVSTIFPPTHIANQFPDENIGSLTDMLLDSFQSAGAEDTAKVLADARMNTSTLPGPSNIQNDMSIDELQHIMEQHCSIEKNPTSSQPQIEQNNDMSILNITNSVAVSSSIYGGHIDYHQHQQMLPSSVVHPTSHPSNFLSSNMFSSQQQYAQMSSRHHDINSNQMLSPGPSNLNPGQIMSPGHSNINAGHMMSPGHPNINPNQVMSPSHSDINAGQLMSPGQSNVISSQLMSPPPSHPTDLDLGHQPDIGLNRRILGPNFNHVNNNNNHAEQVLHEFIPDSSNDSIERLLNTYTKLP